MKFSKAVLTSNYNVICLCETWLIESINSKELLLNDYDIYRKDIELVGDENFHGGSVLAVKNTLIFEQMRTFTDSCVACRKKTKYVALSYLDNIQPPTGSAYRCSVEDFQQLLKKIPKSKPAIICGDLKFLETNWKTNSSSSEEENSILELFQEALLRQSYTFPDLLSESTRCTILPESICFLGKKSIFYNFIRLRKPRGSPHHVRISCHRK